VEYFTLYHPRDEMMWNILHHVITEEIVLGLPTQCYDLCIFPSQASPKKFHNSLLECPSIVISYQGDDAQCQGRGAWNVKVARDLARI